MSLSKGAALLLASTLAVTVSACGTDQKSPENPKPVLGIQLGGTDPCDVAADEVFSQASAVAQRGLREAGYRTLFVPCPHPVAALTDPQLLQGLKALDLKVETVAPDDPRMSYPIAADAVVTILRTMISRNVMLARSLIFTGDLNLIADENVAAMTNRDVLEVALDKRAEPGAQLGAGESFSRAVGEKGLVVSLTNSATSPGPVSVPIADLNLAGDDSVPATDLWTGTRIMSSGGRLTVTLSDGDTALLRIG
ncbi:MAG: hypothetical protein QM774_00380 [Gordonia sp. (in: high G+C Gram-positive bacteria)]|uniref:hypothetical protein n=1 Tax=Gordonia sp. (in: high G+C Gram-positive bacteria) TaxID=84139 RepID=UPI0039E2C741